MWLNHKTFVAACTALSLHTAPVAAQERVRWLVCAITEACDKEKSTLTYTFTPHTRHRIIGDTPANLNIQLHCVSPEWLRSSWSQTLTSNDGWWLGEISRHREWRLLPYQLYHEDPDELPVVFWVTQSRLRNTDFSCELWNIEISQE